MLIKPFLQHQAHPTDINGVIIEAHLPYVKIGEICNIYTNWRNKKILSKAQVLGFKKEKTILSLIGESKGLSRDVVIAPTGSEFMTTISDDLLGCVLDATGNIVHRFSPPNKTNNHAYSEIRALHSPPPAVMTRVPITRPFLTGLKAIDGLITCGLGQRLGIFAAAGCGKTTLMNMLISHAAADVFVVGLIGERGREVTEFTAELAELKRKHNTIVVYATSDFSPLDRCNAAAYATTIAEFFRDQGKRVVLFIDSITRYARALRDVALAAGEPPARRGYPASVFANLPKLLERPGNTIKGSITAFYTNLLENEEEADQLGEEVRSILDGHIYLSRRIAAQNRYPAIDVLNSLSRVMSQVVDKKHQAAAGKVRAILSKIEELQLLVDLGEYKEGENIENDNALRKKSSLFAWLAQIKSESVEIDAVLKAIYEFTQ